jgi:argininosuccinate lyase
MTRSNIMWGGRFAAAAAPALQKINQSVAFDARLAQHDILGSKAHCKMLAKTKIITKAESKKIINGLNKIAKEIAAGKFKCKPELEDIHMNIESALAKIIGDTAGKLHTARSRNDQVVTDFKLWIRAAFVCLDVNLKKLQLALLNKAKKHADTIMPGMTHLQSAQPITFGHHLMAYFEMFKRDRSRIKDACTRLNECPLGSAALAGTSFPIDRNFTAKELKFTAPTANSLDSVSDRDFVMEYLSIAVLCAIHLSRLAEEIILWSTNQFNFIKLSDAFTTGSSIMPQKRNPDAAELIRAKTGRIIGNLNNVLIMMKGLPLAYAKDMQEDKEPVFDTHDTIRLSTTTMAAMIDDIQVDKQKMRQAAANGFSTATDLADWLVKNLKIPFRKAHKISGQIVQAAEKKDCTLMELDLPSMQAIEPKITKAVYTILSIESSVKTKTSFGGTAPQNVKAAIKYAKKSRC